ncbi:hypothetical protein ACWEPM_29940, partial [Streptomyces sp. NPDC004244]
MAGRRTWDAHAGRTAAQALLCGGEVPVGGVLRNGGPEAWLAFDAHVRRTLAGRTGAGGAGAAARGGGPSGGAVRDRRPRRPAAAVPAPPR